MRQDLPAKVVIKKNAHAMTMMAVAWIGISVFAVVAFRAGKEDANPGWVSAAIWAWRLHALIAVAALVLWVFEKPSEVRYVKEESPDEEA
jgi:hypothetical protein